MEIDGAKTCQIQIAQSVPIASPLTWNLVGDPGKGDSTCFSLLVVDDNVGLGEYVCSCACGCTDKHLVGDVATTLNSLTSVGRSGGTKVAAPVTVPRIYPATKYVVFLAPPVNQRRQYLVEVL